jgi:putative PEP-CTERM system TPR-repeat lipoprotein
MRYINFTLLFFALLFFTLHYNVVVAQENPDYEAAFGAYELGDINDSYIYLKRSLEKNPNHLPSKIMMAEVLALSGYYIDSLSEFEESIAQGADLNTVLESYIRVLMILDDYGRILDIPENQLSPTNKGFLRSAKAGTFANRGEYIRAEEYFDLAYQAAPSSINVLNSAARHYLAVSQLTKAKQRIDESLSISTQNSNTYELLARYYGLMGNTQEKITALQTGQSISESHPFILRELVAAYANEGRYEDAKTVLETTLKNTPNDPMARLLQSWLASQLGDSNFSKEVLNDLINQLSLIDTSDLAKKDYALFVSAMANFAANKLEIARGQLEQYSNRNPTNFDAAKLLADIYERERSFVAAANTLERFPTQIREDVYLIARLCRIYINANQNHKCNALLNRHRELHGQSSVFVQVESNLLASRGKLDLALNNLDSLNSSELSVKAQQAVLAIKSDRLGVATELVNQLLKGYPDNSDFLNLKASILKKQNKFDDAERIYVKILSKEESHYASNFNLTHIYYLSNRLKLAKTKAESLMGKRENDTDLRLLYANILTSLGEHEAAFESISKAQSLTRETTKIDQALVKLYVATNDLDKALLSINKLLRNDPTNIALIRQRSGLLFELGRDDEAHNDLRMLFGLLSNDSQSLFALSDIQGQYADTDGAMETLIRADAINPGNLFINRNLAKLALIKKDRQLAQEKITWLIGVAPNNPDVLLLQGDLALFNGYDELAATHYLKAIRVNNSLSPALIGAYQLAQRGVKEDKFLEVFNRLAMEPDINIFSTHLLADFYFAKNDFVNAKNAYISISGQMGYTPIPMVLNNLANVYVSEEKIDAAYNFAQQAYEIVPNEPSVLDTLGWISVLRGEYVQGLSLLRQAFSMNAQDPNLRYHVAYALHKLGRNSESNRELEALLNEFSEFNKRPEAIQLNNLVRQIQ